ncbi:hypothetical protein L596_011860 [Steinernema carpocapsae]|uniref:Uncharacterized protein n=1 Tax=Steinernema carpocapsae TaxID=34508 RepID=A0A4U5NVA3_STECR|nr:hypothetical protein L596_011860 [Steinernema carpocapsae]
MNIERFLSFTALDVIRTYLSFTALQNLGTVVQCLVECKQFTPNLPPAVCRHISFLNLVLFCIRFHTVFAINLKAAQVLNISTSLIHVAFLLYEKPANLTPALMLQLFLSGLSIPVSIYALLRNCKDEKSLPRRGKSGKPPTDAMIHHLRSQAKNKDI